MIHAADSGHRFCATWPMSVLTETLGPKVQLADGLERVVGVVDFGGSPWNLKVRILGVHLTIFGGSPFFGGSPHLERSCVFWI